MDGSMDKVRARMMKMLALARRGEGGEKENAQAMLERLLAKHGMSLDDLDDEHEAKRWVRLKYRGPLEKRLLVSVVCKTLGARTFNASRAKGTQAMHVELTRAQELEIDLLWTAYRREFAKTIDRALIAFIHTNKIYTNAPRDDADTDKSELSPEDIAAITSMMAGMRPTAVHKAIAA